MGDTCVFLDSQLSLLDLKNSQGIDVLCSVPSVLASAQISTDVKVVISGGEVLTEGIVRNVLGSPHRRLVSLYGPTENSIVATHREVTGKEMKRNQLCDLNNFTGLSSIGKPTGNVKCYVADPDTLVLQPIGVYGELLLGGVQVARGYLNRPKLTKEKFIPSPWNPSLQDILYRTGDSVRWCENGELEFGGRIDFQVKLRGLRIELQEIEHALRAQRSVTEAVVLLRADIDTPALVAYVQPPESARDPILLQSLKQGLPAYMVPSYSVGVEDWPRTSSGKIDRKLLPNPENFKTSEEIIKPRTDMEMTVRDGVAEILQREPDEVSVEANFFNLGGNSLTAVQLSRKLLWPRRI